MDSLHGTNPSRAAQLIWTIIVLFSLPIILSTVWFNYAAVILTEQRRTLFQKNRLNTSRKRILITGSSNPYGLDLARAFHKHGHVVVGVDVTKPFQNFAKLSRSLARHHELPEQSAIQDASYIAGLLVKVIKSEKIDLWIDCSADLSASMIAITRDQLQSTCACVAIDRTSAGYLRSNATFHEFLRDRDLPAIEYHNVKSRGDIHRVLSNSHGKRQYLLQSPKSLNSQTLLPRRTLSQTYQDVSLLQFTTKSQMSLEESLEARTILQAFAVVVHGAVEYFSAHLVNGGLQSQLATGSALNQALRQCTATIALELGSECTTNLTLTFRLDEKASPSGVTQNLAVARGGYQPNERYAYARSRDGTEKLVAAYLKALPKLSNGVKTEPEDHEEVKQYVVAKRYLLSKLVTSSVIEPALKSLVMRISFRELSSQLAVFFGVVSAGEEMLYDFRDPLPAFAHLVVNLISPGSRTSHDWQNRS